MPEPFVGPFSREELTALIARLEKARTDGFYSLTIKQDCMDLEAALRVLLADSERGA